MVKKLLLQNIDIQDYFQHIHILTNSTFWQDFQLYLKSKVHKFIIMCFYSNNTFMWTCNVSHSNLSLKINSFKKHLMRKTTHPKMLYYLMNHDDYMYLFTTTSYGVLDSVYAVYRLFLCFTSHCVSYCTIY